MDASPSLDRPQCQPTEQLPGYWESWSNFKFNDMMLGALQKTPADEFIELLEVLKTDIRENGIEAAASNFAHALYPKSPLYP